MADIIITPGSSLMSFTSSLNYTQTLTQEASGSLTLQGSGSTGRTDLFTVNGNNGTLFSVSDDLSNSLFSVNTIAGLPVIEAFADNTVVMGQYGQNVLVVTGSRVGIGTATPSSRLHLQGTTTLLTITDTSYNRTSNIGYADSANLYFANDSNSNTFIGAYNNLFLAYGGGLVGIGTTSPTYGLVVNNQSTSLSGTGTMYIAATLNGSGKGLVINSSTRTDSDAAVLALEIINRTGGNTLAATVGGNVGIGTTSPSLDSGGTGLDILNASYTQLRVRSSANSAGIEFKPASGDRWEVQANNSNQWFVYNRTDSEYRLLIDGSGNVGIGTTSPGYKLEINGGASAASYRLANGFLISQGGSNYASINSWIYLEGIHGLYTATNGAHLYPNNANYGSWKIDGSRNGYNGIEFGAANGNVSLMIETSSNTSGFHNNAYGWQIRWFNGTLYVGKNSYGGGTDATVWDSSNAPRANFDNLMYYQGFTLDANTMATNSTGFTYAVNAPTTGPIARFSTGGSYDMWLNGSYGDGNSFFLRTRNGDTGTLNPWRSIVHSGNIANQSVNYASSAGNADTLDTYHETAFVRLAPNSSTPTNGNFAMGQSGGRNFIQSHAGQPLDINPLGNTVTVNSYVGIGTTSPGYWLDVNSGGVGDVARFYSSGASETAVYVGDSGNSGYSVLVLNSNANAGQMWKGGASYSGWGGAKSLNIYNGEGPIAFHSNNTANSMFIDTSGNVGIGTTSGFNSVSGVETTLQIYNANAASLYLTSANKYAIYSSAGGTLQFYNVTQNNYPLIITSGGDVGIGTTSPSYKLDVSGFAGISADLTMYGGAGYYLRLNGGTGAVGYDSGNNQTLSYTPGDYTLWMGATRNLVSATIKGGITELLPQSQIESDYVSTISAQGSIITRAIAGASVAISQLVTLNSSNQWVLADADSSTTSTRLLGIALNTAGVNEFLSVLLEGTYSTQTYHDQLNSPASPGAPIYISTTAGNVTQTAPTGTGKVVRLVGHNLYGTTGRSAAAIIRFKPDATWIQL
jgi:hypothetical protein